MQPRRQQFVAAHSVQPAHGRPDQQGRDEEPGRHGDAVGPARQEEVDHGEPDERRPRQVVLAVEEQLDRVFGGLEEQQRLSATRFFPPSEECNPEQRREGLRSR